MSVQVKGSGTIGGLDEGLVVSGIVTSSTQINVGSNIRIGNAGVVTATTFSGSGASLTNLPAANLTGTLPAISGANLTNLPSQLTLSNNADNRVITGGSGTNLVGESNLTFDGSTFTVSSGTSGDCKLIIEADTDNNNESDNATLVFKQDGGLEVSSIGHGLLSGDQNGLVLANSCSNGYISFATGSTNGHTNATERLRIRDNGNIGIGNRTSSPDNLLHVHTASGDAVIHIEAAADPKLRLRAHSGESIVQFADASSSNVGEINYVHSGDYLKFHVNGSEKMRIDSSGNLTKPNSSCFQAVVNGSHISAGSYVVFGSVDVNKGNDYNSSNGIFTAPVAGTYFFTISNIAFNNVSTVFRFYLRINNGNIGSGGDAHLRLDMNNDDTDYAPNASYTYYRYMSANDTARVYFVPDDNSASAYGGSDYFKFSGHLVG